MNESKINLLLAKVYWIIESIKTKEKSKQKKLGLINYNVF